MWGAGVWDGTGTAEVQDTSTRCMSLSFCVVLLLCLSRVPGIPYAFPTLPKRPSILTPPPLPSCVSSSELCGPRAHFIHDFIIVDCGVCGDGVDVDGARLSLCLRLCALSPPPPLPAPSARPVRAPRPQAVRKSGYLTKQSGAHRPKSQGVFNAIIPKVRRDAARSSGDLAGI